ncbi:hypothetical protein AVEN_204335-1 [Araneus ventricosus]|uniref:CCHC-type domain-containing protein n=1 Tax=Araneus ventricosus TaxID=182803 RepID=A0A4Y2PW03_ARAVE|nr:hypothetical protein AVEN_204335-1 [Araneus ventricosus]
MRSSCRSVCFLLLMDSKLPPRVGRAWRPIRRRYISVPGVSIGRYPIHLVGLLKGIKRRGHSLGLALRVVTGPGGHPKHIGSDYHQGQLRVLEYPKPVAAFPCWAPWWAAVGPQSISMSYGQKKSGPFSGQHIVPNSSIANIFPTYFLIKRNSTNNETFHSLSPFLVEKAITSNIGEVKSTKKLRSGDLLIEILSRKQSEQIMKIKTFSNISVTVSPSSESLNSSKGVISCGELLNVPLESFLKNCKVRGSAKLPEYIKAGYMRLAVRLYIPNPLRCFKCQRFGHSKTSYRGTLTCARCAEMGHDSSQCTSAEKCVNCKEAHTSFSRKCSAWKLEKEIIATKIKKQIFYPEARKLVKSQTPASTTSYSSIVKNPCTTVCSRNNLGDITYVHNK